MHCIGIPGSSTNNCLMDDPLFPLAALPCEHPVRWSVYYILWTVGCSLVVVFSMMLLCVFHSIWTVCALHCSLMWTQFVHSIMPLNCLCLLSKLVLCQCCLCLLAELCSASSVCALTSIQCVLHTARITASSHLWQPWKRFSLLLGFPVLRLWFGCDGIVALMTI